MLKQYEKEPQKFEKTMKKMIADNKIKGIANVSARVAAVIGLALLFVFASPSGGNEKQDEGAGDTTTTETTQKNEDKRIESDTTAPKDTFTQHQKEREEIKKKYGNSVSNNAEGNGEDDPPMKFEYDPKTGKLTVTEDAGDRAPMFKQLVSKYNTLLDQQDANALWLRDNVFNKADNDDKLTNASENTVYLIFLGKLSGMTMMGSGNEDINEQLAEGYIGLYDEFTEKITGDGESVASGVEQQRIDQLQTLRSNLETGQQIWNDTEGGGHFTTLWKADKLDDDMRKAYNLLFVKTSLTENGVPADAQDIDDVYSLDSKETTESKRAYLAMVTGDMTYSDPNKTTDEFIESEFDRTTREVLAWAMQNDLSNLAGVGKDIATLAKQINDAEAEKTNEGVSLDYE